MKKAVRFLPLLAGGAAIGLLALFYHGPPPQTPPPVPAPPKEPALVAPASKPSPAPPPPIDPTPDVMMQRWATAVRTRDQKAVVDLQSLFLSREREYRDPLIGMARADPDARVRAFCVAVLGRMKTPPPEAFFIERVRESDEYPKRSALEAREKLGTKACLETVDRLASGDPVEAVRAGAARTAKAVRSR
jgi:hypothetical protein